MIIQLVRECPPGHGGVERVAHELAAAWHAQGKLSATISLQPYDPSADDPSLPVPYRRSNLPCIKLGRQLLLPLLSRRLWAVLTSSEALHVHLPCPGLLAVSVMARLMQPGRTIRLHWHAFLQAPSGPQGWLIGLYQWLALRWASYGVQVVVTTSPVLAEALVEEGVSRTKVFVLPCCLGELQERLYGQIAEQRRHRQLPLKQQPLGLIFIGRLDSYKRVDWLIDTFTRSRAGVLHIIGDGPMRSSLAKMASKHANSKTIIFHGRVSESKKQDLIKDVDLLVLPSESSNEAFGIVQLEAMASGIPALALDCSLSGMAWVGELKIALNFKSIGRDQMIQAINLLAADRDLLARAASAAEQRYWDVFARRVWSDSITSITC